MKPVIFHGKAQEAIRGFPQEIRDRLGKALFLIQKGERLGMPLSRAMPVVGSGVSELRLHNGDGQFRTFYFTAHEEGILVFHAFTKKTQTTPKAEILVAKRRLKEMRDD